MMTATEIATEAVKVWRRRHGDTYAVRTAGEYGWAVDGDTVTRLDGQPLEMSDLDVARARARPVPGEPTWQLVDGYLIPTEFPIYPSRVVMDLANDAEFDEIVEAEQFDEIDDDDEE